MSSIEDATWPRAARAWLCAGIFPLRANDRSRNERRDQRFSELARCDGTCRYYLVGAQKRQSLARFAQETDDGRIERQELIDFAARVCVARKIDGHRLLEDGAHVRLLKPDGQAFFKHSHDRGATGRIEQMDAFVRELRIGHQRVLHALRRELNDDVPVGIRVPDLRVAQLTELYPQDRIGRIPGAKLRFSLRQHRAESGSERIGESAIDPVREYELPRYVEHESLSCRE